MGTPSYEGKQVYMGMPGAAEAVISLVTKEFSGARVLAAYEAGYSGF
jgi:hypothetical protein